ncbi:MAG: sporulation integral membrane protein YtvI [Anaerocolumna sp.]
MRLEKQKAFLIRFLYFLVILLVVYFGIKYALPLFMPFVIGLIVASLLRPVIDTITKLIHGKRPIVAIIVLLVFYSIIGALIALVGIKVFTYIQKLVLSMPAFYKGSIEPFFYKASDIILEKYPDIELYLEDFLNSINNTILSTLSKASESVIGLVTGIAGQVPSILIKFLFTIVSSFFFTIDLYKITGFFLKQFSPERQEMIVKIKNNVFGTLFKFIKAYITLLLITFIELTIGFVILKIPNPFLIALIVSVVDLLPILGTGAVLLPWCILGFVFGNNVIGLGILILYIVITIVRQSLEPKIVGQQIGLHPVVTLISIFVGAQLLGVLGIFLIPVMATMIKKLNDEGSIHLFK